MKLLKSKKAIIIIAIIIILLVAGGILGYKFLLEKPTTKKVTSTNEFETEFNTSIEEQYSDILTKYFDTNYLYLYDYNNLARYPDAYKNIMIGFGGAVEEILEEKDNKYKILVNTGISQFGNDQRIVIEGEYKDHRYVPNEDGIFVRGVYEGNVSYKLKGRNEVLPSVKVVHDVLDNGPSLCLYSDDELREIAKAFFEMPVTVTDATYNGISQEEEFYIMGLGPHCRVFLDNSTNNRFNEYRLYNSGGGIDVATEWDNPDVKRNIVKTSNKDFLLVSYTESSKYLEVQLYDKDFKQKWTREFKDVNNFLYDYNNGKISLNIDDELYLINESNGKNIANPIVVPNGNKLKLLSNGDTILITKNSKDFIFYITADGKIKWKSSLSKYKGEIDGVPALLIANEKIYISFYDEYDYYVAVFDKDGKTVVETAQG